MNELVVKLFIRGGVLEMEEKPLGVKVILWDDDDRSHSDDPDKYEPVEWFSSECWERFTKVMPYPICSECGKEMERGFEKTDDNQKTVVVYLCHKCGTFTQEDE